MMHCCLLNIHHLMQRKTDSILADMVNGILSRLLVRFPLLQGYLLLVWCVFYLVRNSGLSISALSISANTQMLIYFEDHQLWLISWMSYHLYMLSSNKMSQALKSVSLYFVVNYSQNVLIISPCDRLLLIQLYLRFRMQDVPQLKPKVKL